MDNSRDMDSLINRVNLLKREHESMVRRNLATLNKTEKILTIKKDKSNFKEKVK